MADKGEGVEERVLKAVRDNASNLEQRIRSSFGGNPDAPTESLLLKKLADAATTRGLLLERQAMRALRAAGLFVEHSFWFEDMGGDGAHRESDVLGLWPHPKHASPFRLEIVVECKRPAVPWALAIDPVRRGYKKRFYRELVTKEQLPESLLLGIADHPYGSETEWAQQGFVFRDKFGDDEIRSACEQAVKAARYRCEIGSKANQLTFVAPAVLLAGGLFGARFDVERGEVNVSPIRRVLYRDRRESLEGFKRTGLQTTLLDVLVLDELESRARELLVWARAYATTAYSGSMPPEATRIFWQRWKNGNCAESIEREAPSVETALDEIRREICATAVLGYRGGPHPFVYANDDDAQADRDEPIDDPFSRGKRAVAQIYVFNAPDEDDVESG